MKLFLSIVCTLLFPLSFWICKYFHPEAFLDEKDINYDTMPFTHLRYSFYALVCLCWAWNESIEYTNESIITKRRIKLCSYLTIGFTISDIIDRFIFNITEFTKEDFIMISLTLMISIYKFYVPRRTKYSR